MSQVLIFSGTTEGRLLAQELAAAGLTCTVSVATEYGSLVMTKEDKITVHEGRLAPKEMKSLIEKGDFQVVVDATHPYATEVSAHIRQAMEGISIPFYRLKRSLGEEQRESEAIHFFSTQEECAKALQQEQGNILLTTGSKELARYTESENLRSRLYVRVLPSKESLAICLEQGIVGRQILAMQGPFTEEMNVATIRQFDIAILVTKQSGRIGGYQEKIKAALKTGCKVYVIGAPEEDQGEAYEVVRDKIMEQFHLTFFAAVKKKEVGITLVGMGMGDMCLLTGESRQALLEAELIIGAERLLQQAEAFCKQNLVKGKKVPRFYQAYMPEEILPILQTRGYERAVLLYSGDTGFYSGAQNMQEALQSMIKLGGLRARIRVCPGISCVSYLAAKIGVSWQDGAIVSIHGRKADVAGVVLRNRKTFVLTSGVKDVNQLGALFQGQTKIQIYTGYRLSAPEEMVRCLTPEQCMELRQEGLYTCLILNPNPKESQQPRDSQQPFLPAALPLPGMPDTSFLRGKVPMTKEEIRVLSICKLKLTRDAVVYDIGCGTGSISVECAALNPDIQVYALDQKAEAIELTEENAKRLSLKNVHCIQGRAPEGLNMLPVPTHAFIGGSTGKLEEIITTLLQKNPKVQIVLNAVTLETIAQITTIASKFRELEMEAIQVQVSRGRELGQYHLMTAENPVYIVTLQERKKER